MQTINITILNGLSVTVAFSIEAADPEVGYPHPHIAEWEITHINGRKPNCQKWLIKQIDEKESARILALCYNSIN